MKKRDDLSNFIVHWCKSTNSNYDEALQILLSILIDESITGSPKNIIKGHTVICFTEAPWKFVFEHNHGNYMPFGISVHKLDAFDFGARPVIYQPKDECKYLHEDIEWRHVSYDPRINYKS